MHYLNRCQMVRVNDKKNNLFLRVVRKTDAEKPPMDEFYEDNTTCSPILNRHCKYECFVNDLFDTTERIVFSKLIVKITFVWFF